MCVASRSFSKHFANWLKLMYALVLMLRNFAKRNDVLMSVLCWVLLMLSFVNYLESVLPHETSLTTPNYVPGMP